MLLFDQKFLSEEQCSAINCAVYCSVVLSPAFQPVEHLSVDEYDHIKHWRDPYTGAADSPSVVNLKL